MKCDCGGTLSPETLESFDFTPMAGIASEVRNVPGLRCDGCGFETLPGNVITVNLDMLALSVVQIEPRLTKELAVFLRKRLRLTQKALAERMDTTRETVAKWECGMSEISPTHDAVLRFLVLSRLVGPARADEIARALAKLDHVRTEPPKPPPPFVIEPNLDELRAEQS